MFSRERKTPIAEWWWTVDRELLGALLALIVIGVMLSFSASPPVAERIGLGPWHFTQRHALFAVGAVVVLVLASMVDSRRARQAALLGLVAGMVLLVAVPFIGFEVKGAQRWVYLFGQSIQPIEYVKPALAVVSAWLISEQMKRGDVPGHILAMAATGAAVALLLMQPDVGQTILVAV